MPKDIYKNIAEDDGNFDNKNNDNIINKNNLKLNRDNNENDVNKINNIELSKNNNFPASQNMFSNYNVNNKEIKQKHRNNATNIEGNKIGIRYNFNQGNNSFSAINNFNNYYVNNNNNTLNFQNNNLLNYNNFCSPNNIDLTNYPQIPNNQPFYGEQNSFINQNITNNYIYLIIIKKFPDFIIKINLKIIILLYFMLIRKIIISKKRKQSLMNI